LFYGVNCHTHARIPIMQTDSSQPRVVSVHGLVEFVLQSKEALVHKSKDRRNSTIRKKRLGDFITLGHTQVCHFVKSHATD
jgi:hypothetical protein